MVCGVYIIKNKKNDKVYIGQSVDIKKRWGRHKRELNNNIHGNAHLQRAWNKYGSESFSFELIKACKPRYLDRFEKLYIHIFDSMNNGYNNDSGGSARKRFSEHTISKIIQNNTGKNNPMYGHNHSKETIAKMSKAHIGKKHSDETKRKMSKNHANVKGKNNPSSKYSLWNNEKCHYDKGAMFRSNVDGSKPRRCFKTKYNGKGLAIGSNMDFVSCELVYDLIDDACKNE